MGCRALYVSVLGAVLFAVGCSGTPQLETRSYPLQQPATEEPLIRSVLDDEIASMGPKAVGAATESYGGKMAILRITPDNVAVVRTTAQGHAAIQKALDESRGADELPQIKVRQIIQQRPIGLLGKTLGERIVIEGRFADRVMLANPIAVVTVDGQSLPKAVNIEIDGTTIEEGVAYKLEGYESGAFQGEPGWLSPNVQQPFQYRASFVVTRVIKPAEK